MKKKKLNGWIVIGICIAAMAAAVGVLYLIGTYG
jgi:membrane protein DedA with SNARE-associated domain